MELSVRRLFLPGGRRALRVALADFSATPWRGLFLPGGTQSAGQCCSNPPLRRFTNFQIKQKLQCHYNTGVLGGRGWITQAALLKTAHWAVFALSSATAPQLFESTRPMSLALLQNKNLSVLAYVEAFWWSEAT